jgi:hypothetical protein
MQLKNFYITDELNKNLKSSSILSDKSEGVIIRRSLEKELRKFSPKNTKYFLNIAKKYLLKKQNNCCAHCGKINKFDLHHIDKDRNNNDISNLVVLCKSCHKKDDARTRKPKKKEPSRLTHIRGILKYFGSYIYHQKNHGKNDGCWQMMRNSKNCLTCYTICLYGRGKRFTSPEKLRDYLIERKRLPIKE